MRILKSSLLDEPLARLNAIADTWDISLEAASVAEMAEALAKHMLAPDAAAHGRDALPIGARKALDALVTANGRAPAAAYERRFGTLRPMGPGRLERERPWLTPANPTEVLWYRGFIFRGFDKSQTAPLEVMFIPTDLLAVLPVPEPDTVAAPSTESISASARNAEEYQPSSDALLDDVTSILAYIQNYEVVVRADGWWSAEARTAAQPMLREADGADGENPASRFAFLLNIIARMRWLRPKDKEIRLVPQPVMDWLKKPPLAQRAALFDAWRTDAQWNDLAHVQGIAFEMPHAWANDPLRERAAVLDLLTSWMASAGESWRGIDDFVSYVKTTNPDFARPDGRYDTWHIRDVRTNEYLTSFEHWDRVEGALIRYLLNNPLRWLGYVYAQGDKFALSEAARAMVATAEAPALPTDAPRKDAFRLEPDGDVIVHTSARFERFQLARVANWTTTRGEDYIYRLAPESVNAAIKQGIPVPRIVEFLEQYSGKPMPPNLIKAIKRLEQNGPEVRMEQAFMLRTKDAETMEMLLTTHAVRKAMLERVSPTCALMRQREARSIASAILRTGLLIDV